MYKTISILGLLVMAVGIAGLLIARDLFSESPLVIAVQVCAVALLLWARLTFGRRSFHAAANPTAGGIVTTGPYAYIRHPIYTAACLFVWAGVIAHWSTTAAVLGSLVLIGALVRMGCEELMVVEQYPEYAEYARKTKRMIPFVF
jgi:protein-S-isoprenylcysteine O-methyltransferase Ste14